MNYKEHIVHKYNTRFDNKEYVKQIKTLVVFRNALQPGTKESKESTLSKEVLELRYSLSSLCVAQHFHQGLNTVYEDVYRASIGRLDD